MNFDTRSEMAFDSDKNKDRFSVFDMSKSHFSDFGGSDPNFMNSNGSSGI